MIRHPDFERIKNEFEDYYCKGNRPCPRGEQEYKSWLQALALDETLPYGQTKESFQWARDMIRYLKQDVANKYYEVLVGFPLRSMNNNIYKERDLLVAAHSLVGAHPGLNHKDEYWFSPENPLNKWGVLTVTGAKYADGAVEAILQVPKSAVCPICNGAKMVDLFDTKKIVNVSLEGGCATTHATGKGTECDGFTFEKKGFCLLTTDVLPGIPLARVFAIERFLPFSQARHAKKRSVKIIGLENMSKTKEDVSKELQAINDEIGKLEAELAPLSDYHKRDEISAKLNTLYAKKNSLLALTGLEAKPHTAPKEGDLSTTPAFKPLGTAPDDQFQCPAGKHWSGQEGKCIPNEAAPLQQTHIPEGTDVALGTPAASDDSKKPHNEDYVPSENAKKAIETGDFDACVAAVMADGKDEDSAKAICAAKCRGEGINHEVELADALSKRATAEADLSSAKVKFDAEIKGIKAELASTKSDLTKERDHRIKLEGRVIELTKAKDKYDESMRRWNNDRIELESRANKRGTDLTEAIDNMNKYKQLFENLQKDNESTLAKYRESLTTNMALNRKLTAANEETLRLLKLAEQLEERLKKAKRLGKNISIKV